MSYFMVAAVRALLFGFIIGDEIRDLVFRNNGWRTVCSEFQWVEFVADFPSGPTEPKQNGDVEKKEDSGNETGAGEGEPEEESDQVFYDKAKSFFDNISCEAVERSKG